MASHRVNPYRVQLHRSYSVSELAARCGVHKNSIRNWQRDGLDPVEKRKPLLFHGTVVRAFLVKRRASHKRPCQPGTIFCFRCRDARAPVPDQVEYVPHSPTSGNLGAFCGTCGTQMHRRVREADLAKAMPGIPIRIRKDSHA